MGSMRRESEREDMKRGAVETSGLKWRGSFIKRFMVLSFLTARESANKLDEETGDEEDEVIPSGFVVCDERG